MKVMNESEWLSSRIPRSMLMALEARAKAGEIDRELRLFACTCVRHIGHLLDDERSWKAVVTAERYANGTADREELEEAYRAAEDAVGAINLRIKDANVSDRLGIDDSARPENATSDRGVNWDIIDEAAPLGRVRNAAKAALHSAFNKKFSSHRTGGTFEWGAWYSALNASQYSYLSTASRDELAAIEEAFLASSEDDLFYEHQWQADLLRCRFGNPFCP